MTQSDTRRHRITTTTYYFKTWLFLHKDNLSTLKLLFKDFDLKTFPIIKVPGNILQIIKKTKSKTESFKGKLNFLCREW